MSSPRDTLDVKADVAYPGAQGLGLTDIPFIPGTCGNHNNCGGTPGSGTVWRGKAGLVVGPIPESTSA